MPRYFARYNHGRVILCLWRGQNSYDRDRYTAPYPTTIPFDASNIEIARIKARQLLGWPMLKEK